jgi:stress response protein YsnF
MGKTLVALFRSEAQARSAMDALVTSGIQQDYVRTSLDKTSGAASGVTDRDRFFRSVFGTDDRLAAQYSQTVDEGHTMVTVDIDNDEEGREATDILDQFGPVDIDLPSDSNARYASANITGASGTKAGTSTATTSREATSTGKDGMAVPVIEEQVNIDKRAVQQGGVRVVQRTTTEPVQEQITLRDERVSVERHRLDEPVVTRGLANFQEGSFEMRETDEVPVVDKKARVVEEVVVEKNVQERTETVQETARRIDVDIEQIPATDKTTPKQSR